MGWFTHRKWHGYWQRKIRCEFRKPRLLCFQMRRVSLRTRQSNAHLVAEMEGSVVMSAHFDRFYRKICPIRELICNQSSNEGYIDMARVIATCRLHNGHSSTSFNRLRAATLVGNSETGRPLRSACRQKIRKSVWHQRPPGLDRGVPYGDESHNFRFR